MSPQQNLLLVQYVELSSATVKRASDELAVHRAGQKQAADLRPATLDFLLTNNLIDTDQKQAADALLGSHSGALGLLKTAGEQIVALRQQLSQKSAELGTPASDKSAGDSAPGEYNSLEDPMVGRRTSEKKASDLAIMKVLNAPGD